MPLVELRMQNFRCYTSEVVFPVHDLTALIGRNDVGKSAILDALDAFFNDTIESTDQSVDANSDEVCITCKFDGIADELVLDSSVETSALAEGILNRHGQLEVRKVWTFGKRKVGSVYINALHPSDSRLKNLLSLKNATLKSFAEQHSVDLEGVPKTKNPPIRERIRQTIGNDRQEMLLKVDGSLNPEDNLKTIWSKLKKLLPVYSVFKTDKSFDDKDGDVKDPLQSAIDEALALPEIQERLEEIETKVREYSTDVAERTIAKLSEFDSSLSENLKSDFGRSPSYGKIFDLKLLNEKDVPLNKRGSGVRRLVILAFFQAQAEKRRLETGAPSIIYALEEPETSQHPDHQILIIRALVELSKQSDVQVLFTTHCANLVREIPLEALRLIVDDGGECPVIHSATVASETQEAVVDRIIETLGILPHPADRVRLLLFVEGSNDVVALKLYSALLAEHDPEYVDLHETEAVGYVVTGGSTLLHYVEQQYLGGLGKPEVHIYDGDNPTYVKAAANINAEGNDKKIAFVTNKRELENYLHPKAIVESYLANGAKGFTFSEVDDEMDVALEVARAHFTLSSGVWDDQPSEKQKNLADGKKKLLNSQAVQKMTIDRLKARNGFDEIAQWLSRVSSLCRK